MRQALAQVAKTEASIITTEGNVNNISVVIERKKDAHIRAYIRLGEALCGKIYR